jgi:hypothetical protein
VAVPYEEILDDMRQSVKEDGEVGTIPQRCKTGNEKTTGYISVKPIPWFVVYHFYRSFYLQIWDVEKG